MKILNLPKCLEFVYSHKYYSPFESEETKDGLVIKFQRKNPYGMVEARGKLIIPNEGSKPSYFQWFFSNQAHTLGYATSSIDLTEAWFKDVILEIDKNYKK
jgi:hypothetical protein